MYMYTTVHVLTFSLFFFSLFFLLQKWLIIFLLLIISLTELYVGSNSVSNRTAVLVVKQIGLPLHSCLILLNTCTFNNYSLKSRWIVAKYLPSRESGEVNIPKATIHRDWKE